MQNSTPSSVDKKNDGVWTEDRLALARKSCNEWRGTPFRTRIGVKGYGTDCIHFILNVLKESGVIPPFKLPYYSDHVGGKGAEHFVSDTLCEYLNATTISNTKGAVPNNGDILIFKSDHFSNHVGIFFDDQVWHAMARLRVDVHQWVHMGKHVHQFVRFYRTGYKIDTSTLNFNKHVRTSPVTNG